MSKTLHLYKVQADGWREPEFAAACNQMEAIDCVSEIDPAQDCGKYTVAYIGEVHLSDTRNLDEQLAKVMERNEKLKNELQRICEGKLPTVEQIKSVYAASGILSSLNEKTDSDNLMALWATLKEWHKELSGETV